MDYLEKGVIYPVEGVKNRNRVIISTDRVWADVTVAFMDGIALKVNTSFLATFMNENSSANSYFEILLFLEIYTCFKHVAIPLHWYNVFIFLLMC